MELPCLFMWNILQVDDGRKEYREREGGGDEQEGKWNRRQESIGVCSIGAYNIIWIHVVSYIVFHCYIILLYTMYKPLNTTRKEVYRKEKGEGGENVLLLTP